MAKGQRTKTGRKTATAPDHYVAGYDADGAGSPEILQSFASKAVPGCVTTHAVVSATVTSGTLSAADDSIIFREFENRGTVEVYICGDGGAATNQKKRLDPGQSWADPYTCHAWTVIAASGTQAVHVTTIKAAA